MYRVRNTLPAKFVRAPGSRCSRSTRRKGNRSGRNSTREAPGNKHKIDVRDKAGAINEDPDRVGVDDLPEVDATEESE